MSKCIINESLLYMKIQKNQSPPFQGGLSGAVNRNRTDDLFLTMEMLYRLSYNGVNKRYHNLPYFQLIG